AELGRRKTAAFLLYVLAFLNGGKDRRIGGRASYPIRLQPLHQGGFVVSRRRLGEVLFRPDRLEAQLLAFGDYRQAVLHLFVFLVGRILAFLVDLEENFEFEDAAG